jgi:peptidoglycan/LPS O-acetylase OafA/YrhL
VVVLGKVARGRDNNFNLIRVLAAIAVLVSHAWPITNGAATAEPLAGVVGANLGTLAVYIFFATSGFLITASFARAASAPDFIVARALRLLPSLAVSVLLVALVIGPLVTTLPSDAYLSAPETWTFVIRNITLVKCQYTLPGVFGSNPLPVIEGSIWTLNHEVICYAFVLAAGVAGLFAHRRALVVALCAYGALWLLATLAPNLPHRLNDLRALSLPFAMGMAAWVWRDRLPLNAALLGTLITVAALTRQTPAAFPALIAAITYATLWCAFIPSGRMRAYNKLGDYSYGLYLYAFPLQGLAVWLAGPMSPAANIAMSLPAALCCAVLSWHLIEKPALTLRDSGAHSRAQRIARLNLSHNNHHAG